MKKQPNKKLIGFFSLTGIALFAAMMLVFVGDKIFVKDSELAVMYFSESLKGLRAGSPVVFRGVEVGRVTKIDIVADLDNMTFRLPVFINIDESVFSKYGKHRVKSKKEFIKLMVEKGLKARLATQNILTGQLMIETEIMPDQPIVYRALTKNFVEIPTVLSPMGEITKGLQDLPIKSILENFNTLLKTTNDRLPGVLGQMEEFAASLNSVVKNTSGDRTTTIDNLNRTIRNIGDAAQALRNFADYVERHPEALLRGKGGSY